MTYRIADEMMCNHNEQMLKGGLDAVSHWIADLQGKQVQRHLLHPNDLPTYTCEEQVSYFDDDSSDDGSIGVDSSLEDLRDESSQSTSHNEGETSPEMSSQTSQNLSKIEKVSDMLLVSIMTQYLDAEIPNVLTTDSTPRPCPSDEYHWQHQNLMIALKFRFELMEAIHDIHLSEDGRNDDNNPGYDADEEDLFNTLATDFHQATKCQIERAKGLLKEMIEHPIPDLADLIL